MTPSGDTWGIGGPTFLVGYVVLGVAVAVAVARIRRGLTDAPSAGSTHGLDALPYDVAYLNGGGELAVCAALSAMRRLETISTVARGTVAAAGRPDARADELERAVHHAAVVPIPRHQLVRVGAVASALHRIEARLRGAGLLLSPERRRRIRALSGWTFALAAFGITRIVAGIENGRPVGFLVILVIVTVVVGLGQAVAVPRRSRAGDAALRELEERHHALSPAMEPDWTVYGPAAAALAVGVFGLRSLWASDPQFATELALQQATSSGGGGDSGGGGGGCGGGGCGGGCGG